MLNRKTWNTIKLLALVLILGIAYAYAIAYFLQRLDHWLRVWVRP